MKCKACFKPMLIRKNRFPKRQRYMYYCLVRYYKLVCRSFIIVNK